ncbi:dGTP triphosphohydrolase [Roseateles toxinivorans]|uniref:Deoxyguanosinetriphosphate triphosphohydrolase-like protein n=1 Tax=Roseateles toxinivorans TaxID=270368 RepID=A0A4R6QD97_9BURK|nr:dNTP triphosphohydrolase [Roseateles toxinivorans]TDP60638.1 dGTPase [Roseateles toxinivorans]
MPSPKRNVPGKLYSIADSQRCVQIGNRPGTADYRSCYRRDYARLIHSPAFRRLQGKTQLFPGTETDFFRNRLTHSIEVAQIAKTIAMKLNSECKELLDAEPSQRIDYDLIEVAALAHDIGHPPFGHNGEKALNECMQGMGGFEGNAQSLRILARLEKRLEQGVDVDQSPHRNGKDARVGLNLTYRSLASILKYDQQIGLQAREGKRIEKGFYKSEAELVANIKAAVLKESGQTVNLGEFKTIECQIMDIADDIAYSTYDLEDTFKAEFLSPLRLLWRTSRDGEALKNVHEKVNFNLEKEGIGRIDEKDLLNHVQDLFAEIFEDGNEAVLRQSLGYTELLSQQIASQSKKFAPKTVVKNVLKTIFDSKRGIQMDVPVLSAYQLSDSIAGNGYLRTSFTASLVGNAIEGVEIRYNDRCPALSKVYLNQLTRTRVEILKHLTYELTIMSPRLKVVENRGADIIKDIFDVLSKSGGERLLPEDYRDLHRYLDGAEDKKRIICDFIACMTDRYALEFYRRLHEAGESIFKPF